tara:strand:+ start:6246 stop:6764 length:519 start_codon:yes stop_codon:yes gene_type:complete
MMLSCVPASTHTQNQVKEIAVMDSFAVGKPKQQAVWSTTPSVRICAATKVPSFRVSRALSYWEMLGYKFDGVFADYNLNCGEPRYGEIIVTLPTGEMSENHLASTRIYTEKHTSNIAKAKIFIYPKDGRTQRVLEHEIGHALGWLHYPQKYHMMNPSWHAGGYDSTGLKNKK